MSEVLNVGVMNVGQSKFATTRQECTRGGQVVDRKQDESVGYQIYQISKQIYLIYFIIPG